MPALAFLGLLIILGLSGGINGGAGLANSASELNPQVASASNSRTAESGSSYRTTSYTTTSSVNVPAYKAPYIETLEALNIEDDSASFRGSVNMYSGKNGIVFVAYGYNLKSVRTVTSGYTTYEQIPEATNDKVRTYVLDRRANDTETYSRRISGLITDATYYFKVCVEYDTALGGRAITCGNVKSFSTNDRYTSSSRFYEPRVSIERAYNITNDSATLSGRIDMNDGEDGIIFFVYGEDVEQIRDVENLTSYSGVDEDDENLQKDRVGVSVLGEATYEIEAVDMDGGVKQYYRLCVQYDGERDGMVCSSVRDFTTDEKSPGVAPYVETTGISVGYGWVKFTSLIQVNKYNNGVAFVVVGNDKGKVTTVAERDSFERVRQSGYELQKVLIDDDVDWNQTYTKTITFLEPSLYYYRTCLEYEGEDKYNRATDVLVCDEVKFFTQY